jgi:hypothetical protein
MLDRWLFTATRPSGASVAAAATGGKTILKKVFMNYCGIGVDAMIAMKFDSARKSR